MDYPIINSETIPYVTTDQMREVDRAMIDDFHIELVQMMENAGRNLAQLARTRFLGGDPREKTVVVLAGTGGNGGGALVAARHLHIHGASVTVYVTAKRDDYKPVPQHQYDILERIQRIQLLPAEAIAKQAAPDLIIDGIIGYSLTGAPYGNAAELIAWANDTDAPVLSLDAPSGIDTTSGTVYTPSIRAAATLTLALPKQGLRMPDVEERVGELYLANISVPPELYAAPALELRVGAIFAQSDIVAIQSPPSDTML